MIVPFVELDEEDDEDDGPIVTFGLGSFIGAVIPPSLNGTISYAFDFLCPIALEDADDAAAVC